MARRVAAPARHAIPVWSAFFQSQESVAAVPFQSLEICERLRRAVKLRLMRKLHLLNPIRVFAACLFLSSFAGAAELFDLQGLVDAAVTSGAKSVTIPAGIYRVEPPGHGRWAHLNLKNLTNFTIKAKGVTMLCAKKATAVDMSGCSNVTVRGLTVDFDPMILTQGVVTEWAADSSWFEVKIDAGYPQSPAVIARMDAYDAKTLRLKPDCWTMEAKEDHPLVIVEPGRVRVPWQRKNTHNNVEVGDLVAICDPGPHCFTINGCSHCTLRDVTTHGAGCFGVIEDKGEANRYGNFRIVPGPKPAGATRARIRSTCADGFHSNGATVGPTLEDCRIESTGDDAIAIHGKYFEVLKGDGRELVVAGSPKLGDRMRVVSPKVVVRGEAMITNVVRITDAKQREEFAALWPREQTHRPPRFDEMSVVQVDADVSPAAGDRVSYPGRIGGWFAIRDTTIFNNRARGILIKAGPGVIEDNTIDGSVMCGIILCPEFYWNEACFSRDVIIRNNTVRNTGLGPANGGSIQCGAITVAAERDDGQTPVAGGHRNIRIENNTIEGCPGPCIEVTSAEHVTITGNRFKDTHHVLRKNGERYHVDTGAAIWLDNDTDVTLAKNKISGMGEFGKKLISVTERVKKVTGAGE